MVGYLLYADEQFVVTQLFDSDGNFDGIDVRLTENVFRFEEDSRYLEKMKKLIGDD